MKRSEILAKIAVSILEADTNEMLHGDNKDMSYEQIAHIALKVCEQEGMKPPKVLIALPEKHEGFGGTSYREKNEWEPKNE